MRYKAVGRAIDYVAFSCHTYGSKNVITCTHDISDARFVELVDYAGGAWLKLVFKYDEPYQVKP